MFNGGYHYAKFKPTHYRVQAFVMGSHHSWPSTFYRLVWFFPVTDGPHSWPNTHYRQARSFFFSAMDGPHNRLSTHSRLAWFFSQSLMAHTTGKVLITDLHDFFHSHVWPSQLAEHSLQTFIIFFSFMDGLHSWPNTHLSYRWPSQLTKHSSQTCMIFFPVMDGSHRWPNAHHRLAWFFSLSWMALTGEANTHYTQTCTIF